MEAGDMDTEGARQHLEAMLVAVSDFPLLLAGVQAGLFPPLAEAGDAGLTPAELAAPLGYREDQVRIWAETLYAIGVLDDAGDGRLRFAPGYAALLTPGAPSVSLVPALQRLGGLLRTQQLQLAEDFTAGAERPLTDQVPPMELQRAMVPALEQQARVRLERIYAHLPAAMAKLGAGARVLEVGCRLATQSLVLAEAFPDARFVGIDPAASSIELGRELVASRGLTDRVQLQLVSAEAMTFDGEFDLAIMDVVLHEVQPAVRPAAVAAIHRALKPGGLLISNDFYYPTDRAGLRAPQHALAVFDQALELTWGARHLSEDGVRRLLLEAGFARCTFQPVEMPGPTPMRPGTPAWYLSTVAERD
jgi:ubiquinone/menaquinone biosynthesis C-methylase UbiE